MILHSEELNQNPIKTNITNIFFEAEQFTLTGVVRSKLIYRFQGQCSVPEMSCNVQGQGRVRSPKTTMHWIGYVRHMFYGLFCSSNAMGTLKY